jgi:hypothetical protein
VVKLAAIVVAHARTRPDHHHEVNLLVNGLVTWHHFDPPWREEQHHRPEGLIALCQEHASKADAGAFTIEQLHRFKREGRARAAAITGRFNWMRRDLLAVVGSNFYLNQEVLFQIGQRPCIWFTRDDDGYLLLNFWMPTTSGDERPLIHENFWLVPPSVKDFECPPNGRRIHIRYANGDQFRVEFFDLNSADDLTRRYPESRHAAEIAYPITAVEIWEKIPGTPIEFDPKTTRIPGGNQITRALISGNQGPGLRVDLPPGVGGRIFEEQEIRIVDLVGPDHPILHRARFVRCRIVGPCVLIPINSHFEFDSYPTNAVLWELPAGNQPTGGVGAESCLFDHCTFVEVGLAFRREELQRWKEQANAPQQ